ncbi:ubiquinone/menaquinone biosynthesis C-methylase UbiE [Litorivivens lipolytica]|uniref:Ubiquinone/menaquinone biosynthesis C-methylase UbiE n=1 Tax=Litorivivens lipolytica TaxID=1524264 RepID=A0A7W4W4J7_9GAMM|nr:class I SAM-dependent methyltransferase [Litorivivens lipolytica]MBB3047289.1 ubiquinone/menaquinone biosynthesis C-methylase UbiE [Litorivivens lipolytica]
MSFYEQHILPHVIDFACGDKVIMEQRQQVLAAAEGRVLEVGMGSGLNLRYYNPDKVDFVWGLEPSEGMRKKAHKNLEQSPVRVEWLGLPGEEIPLESDSADTVVLTFTLCTIPDWNAALQQMRRVLKPGGKLLFCEHGAAPDEAVARWQNRVNPLWKKVAGGCHLNRRIPELIRQGGFDIKDIEASYLPKTPRIAGFRYRGYAIK